MKLLIIGGTRFLGRHLVESVLARGHELTLFNRGKSNPELFPQIEQLRGDRDGGLDVLLGRRWDVVIDTSGYFPRIVQASAEALSQVVDCYVFISSISVYKDFTQPGMDESYPVATLQDEGIEEITNESYGALKALCEQAAERAMPGRVLVIRPGLIVGPHDATDRFTYWPYRVAQGGEMLAPGSPSQSVQFIDVRDLAEWTIRLVEERKTGIYNATGPDYPLTMGHFLEESRVTIGSETSFVWVSESFLVKRNLDELPLWVPEEEYPGFHTVNCRKAINDGLVFRPLADTVRATLAWRTGDATQVELRTGLKSEQEQQLLREWRESGEE